MRLGIPARRRDVLRRRVKFRSAVTGQYVSRIFVLLHPAQTVCERSDL